MCCAGTIQMVDVLWSFLHIVSYLFAQSSFDLSSLFSSTGFNMLSKSGTDTDHREILTIFFLRWYIDFDMTVAAAILIVLVFC